MEEDKRAHPPPGLGEAYLTAMTDSGRGLVLFGHGLILLDQWRNTPAYKDGTIGMVLGEWIEENAAELVATGNWPEDIEQVVGYLREFTNAPGHNQF